MGLACKKQEQIIIRTEDIEMKIPKDELKVKQMKRCFQNALQQEFDMIMKDCKNTNKCKDKIKSPLESIQSEIYIKENQITDHWKVLQNCKGRRQTDKPDERSF